MSAYTRITVGDGRGSGGTIARTDGEGRFEARDVEPGPRLLVAQADGYAENMALEVTLDPRRALQDVVLELRRSARIDGTLRLPSGEVAQREIQLHGPGTSATARSDARGGSLVEHLPAGAIELRAGGDDRGVERDEDLRAPQRLYIELAEGARLSDLELRLAPAATIRGRVLQRTGPLFGWARVTGRSVAGEPLPLLTVGPGDDSFVLRGLAAGDYVISVSQGEHRRIEQTIRVPAGGTMTLELALPD